MIRPSREMRYSEQVVALVTPETRSRLDVLAAARVAEDVPWPDRSLGAVVRDVIDAGLDAMAPAQIGDPQVLAAIEDAIEHPEQRVPRPKRDAS